MREAVELAGALQVAVKALQFYSPEHPQSRQALSAVERAAQKLLGAHPRVTLTLSRGKLLLDGQPVDATSPQVRKLSEQFEQRATSGIVLMEGVTERELLEVVRVLAAKPEAVKQAGGAQKMMEPANVLHARFSQVRYEAVTEGEEVVWSHSVRRVDEADGPATLPDMLRRFLARHVGGDIAAAAGVQSGEGAENDTAELHDQIVEGMQSTAIDATSTSAGREMLRESIAGLEPELQLALLLSINKLPDGALRQALEPAANEIAADAVASGIGGVGGGEAARDATDFFARLLTVLPESDRDLLLLKDRLHDLGISREQLDDVLDVIGWDSLSIEDKLRKISDPRLMYALPMQKFVEFIETLLETGRGADALAVLTHYSAGLTHESREIRQAVTETLGHVAGFMKSPGTTPEIDQLLLKTVFTHMLQEEDAKVQLRAVESAAAVIGGFVATARAAVAHSNLMRGGAALASGTNPNHREAYMALVRAVSSAERMKELTDQMYTTDSEKFTNEVLPYITFLGAPITRALVEALGEEEDRNRRGRLVRALKSIGKPAYPALVEALHGNIWYVVRNVLNVLGDIGTPDLVTEIGSTLLHSDARVRRAAVRALGKIRGDEAERLLVDALGDKDRETQHEILICLGAMKAQSAVPPLIELAKPRRLGGDDAARETVITTLGQIGAPAAVPVLLEIASKRSGFAKESPALRIAAAKSLAGIATPEAGDALQKVVAGETNAEVKSQLEALVR